MSKRVLPLYTHTHTHICVQLASVTYLRPAAKKEEKNAEEKKGKKKNVQLASRTYTPKWNVMESGPKAGRGLKVLVYEAFSY